MIILTIHHILRYIAFKKKVQENLSEYCCLSSITAKHRIINYVNWLFV